jgi:hypothetical protein
MPRTHEDVENYLIKLGRKYEAQGHTYLIHVGPDLPMIAARVAPPIVAVNVSIGPTPKDESKQLRLFRRLLQLNATDLMHASYGLEDGHIILSAALALENLDDNELEATLSDIDLALVRHTSELRQLARD